MSTCQVGGCLRAAYFMGRYPSFIQCFLCSAHLHLYCSCILSCLQLLLILSCFWCDNVGEFPHRLAVVLQQERLLDNACHVPSRRSALLAFNHNQVHIRLAPKPPTSPCTGTGTQSGSSLWDRNFQTASPSSPRKRKLRRHSRSKRPAMRTHLLTTQPLTMHHGRRSSAAMLVARARARPGS